MKFFRVTQLTLGMLNNRMFSIDNNNDNNSNE